jgi:CheY-like chemotaxis protein
MTCLFFLPYQFCIRVTKLLLTQKLLPDLLTLDLQMPGLLIADAPNQYPAIVDLADSMDGLAMLLDVIDSQELSHDSFVLDKQVRASDIPIDPGLFLIATTAAIFEKE